MAWYICSFSPLIDKTLEKETIRIFFVYFYSKILVYFNNLLISEHLLQPISKYTPGWESYVYVIIATYDRPINSVNCI